MFDFDFAFFEGSWKSVLKLKFSFFCSVFKVKVVIAKTSLKIFKGNLKVLKTFENSPKPIISILIKK